ncbi:acyl-coenzyme A synthetase ACSM4, mitochondrial-like [Thamnophis elegans]|uniref:acyl-coenzyme A synthetase ACSM4, mitochondrial-like n=1 Tax=Thamnophis elegans TaxID=35005 RepID=UPI001377090B|nr:acyl-coenzyme A synthetase ACSM4, mitochondrial-like [Thamnophis elegans]
MKTSLSCYTIWKRIPKLFPRYSRYFSSPIAAQYEAVIQGQDPLPEYFNFASDVLDKWTQIEKDGKRSSIPALWWVNGRGGEVRWSFEEMGLHSRKAANILTDRCGLRKGDRILVVLSRIPEWWLVIMACIRTGIVAIPATSQVSAKDIEYRLKASGAKCLITTEALRSTVDSIAPQCASLKTKLLVSSDGEQEGWLNFDELLREAPANHTCVKTKMNDPMLVYFTSGTTGAPKMVEHSQGSLGFRPIICQRSWLYTTSSDLTWSTADTSWVVAALGSFFDPWVLGSCVFIHNLPTLEKTTILRTLSQFPITAFLSIPTLFRILLREDLTSFKFKSLQYCISGGEPISLEVVEEWKNKTGLDIYQLYGQTEMGSICSVSKEMKIKPGTMGKALFPYDVQIVDQEANILPPGKEGEIAVRIKPERPLGFFTQYIDAPQKMAATTRGDFFLTGDRGVMDEDGYFRFIGRSDDIIKSSGYRIGPFEVESVLLKHPAVAEVAAVSSPDPVRGEVVKAFVVLSTEYATHNKEKLTTELQEHVKRMTAPYKYPRKVEFVQQLPKSQTGKIRRNELRDQEFGRV